MSKCERLLNTPVVPTSVPGCALCSYVVTNKTVRDFAAQHCNIFVCLRQFACSLLLQSILTMCLLICKIDYITSHCRHWWYAVRKRMFLLWLMQQSVFKCSTEAHGTYSRFSGADLNYKHLQLQPYILQPYIGVRHLLGC